nr:hypothetical protein [Tanacetum cinerariifolium]
MERNRMMMMMMMMCHLMEVMEEHGNMNASGIQNNEEMVHPQIERVRQLDNMSKQEHRRMNARVSQNIEGMVNLRHQNVKQKGLPLVGN